jgi:hypothetical protein
MYKEMGMHVIHYGHEESDVICDEHVTVTDRALLERVYGIYDWKNQLFIHCFIKEFRCFLIVFV